MARYTVSPCWDVRSPSDDFAAALASADFASIQDTPFTSDFARLYYPLASDHAFRDVSFLVRDQGRTVAVVLATLKDGRIDYFGQPAHVVAAASLSEADTTGCQAAAVGFLEETRRQTGALSVTLVDACGAYVTPIADAALKFGATPEVRIHAMADLSRGEDGLHPSLRKSFRSLLNWGRREMRLSFVNRQAPDRDSFEAYHAFHRRVAGFDAHPPESWDIMFSYIAAGKGELVLGHWQGELVAGTMFIDGDRLSYYISGVYDRTRFDKPMAHWPLWSGLLRVPQRGLTTAELGYIPVAGQASPKEVSIGYFKRGFASCLENRLCWTWRAPEHSAE